MASRYRIAPEVDALLFSFPMHFTWEFLQAPLFRSMEPLSHFEGILVCLQATLGDMALVLVAFWVTCLVTGTRRWSVRADARDIAVWLGTGLFSDCHHRISQHRGTGPLDLCSGHATFAVAWNGTYAAGAVDCRPDDRLLVHEQAVIRSNRLIATAGMAYGPVAEAVQTRNSIASTCRSSVS